MPLSAEYLFYHAIRLATVGNLSDGILFEEAAAALALAGQPNEQEWPYSGVHPNPWMPPKVTTIWRADLQHQIQDVVNQIATIIVDGQPAILGIKLSAELIAPNAPDFVIPGLGTGFGGHAVLVVGSGHIGNDQYFLIRNSWGDRWGEQGYAWLAASYLTDKLVGFGSVTNGTKGI